MRFIDDAVDFVMGFLIPAGAFLAVILVLGDFYGQYQCENYKDITGKNTKYAQFDTCYVETSNGFQRWDEYKARSVASEGLKHE